MGAVMEAVWPWMAMAGLGALHGLNPATGWLLAAAWGLRTGGRRQALRAGNQRQALCALWPIGLGHAASVALVALLAVAGGSAGRWWLQCAVAALLLLSLAAHVWRRAPKAVRAPAGQLGMAAWSFLVSSLHGAGLMVVPALLPLCGAGAASGLAAGPLATAIAALALHGAAMLLVSALVASGVLRGVALCSRRAAQAQSCRSRLGASAPAESRIG